MRSDGFAKLRELTPSARRSRWLEERCRQLVNTAKTPFVAFETDGTVIDWNEGAEQLFGWPRETITGRSIFGTVLPPPFSPANLADIRPTPADEDAMVRGRRREATARNRGGHLFPVELHVWATRFGASHTLNAFVHEVVPPDPPGKSSCQMGAIIESSGEAIIGTELDGSIRTWNHAAEEMFGLPSPEAVGQPIFVVVPPDAHEALSCLLTAAKEEGVVHHETSWLAKDGSSVDVAVSLSVVRDPDGGEPNGFSVIARDVTEERRMSAELNATLAALDEAAAEAREAEARGRDFLADAAHQLRTPTAGIRACAEALLRHPSFPAEAEGVIAEMMAETSRAARLIGALLQMARLDQGAAVAPAPCDVVAVCREEVQRACSLAPGLAIETHVTTMSEDKPEVDADALKEILANLLDNARRHARNRVDLTVATTDDQLQIKVTDDGPGVRPDLAERVFDRFVTLDGKGGSGLGLPIARGLARAHGGDLAYQGKAFVLRLPLVPPP